MPKRIDLSEKKLGCLTVIRPSATKRVGKCSILYWECRCDCGQIITRKAQNLLKRTPSFCSKACPIPFDRYKRLIGTKRGERTIIGVVKASPVQLVVKCDCGAIDRCRLDYSSGPRGLRCKKCGSYNASQKMKGRPAHNRLSMGEAARNAIYASYRRGAHYRKIPFAISMQDFVSISQRHCHYCGDAPDAIREKNGTKRFFGSFRYNGLDRVDSSRGYSIENVVACCATCNYMKQDNSQKEFLAKVQQIYLHSLTVGPHGTL